MSDVQQASQKGFPRVMSGIEALDRAIGGFPAGSVIVIAGSPGSGHDQFARQILFNGARAGNRVTYLTVDRPPEDIVWEMLEGGMDVEALVTDNKWNFLNGCEARLKVRQGELGVKVLLDMLSAVARSAKAGDWTCVDTLSKMLEYNGHKEITAFLDDITLQAREGRGLHFVTIVEGFHDQKTIGMLMQACDGYIRMSLDGTRAEPIGTLRIEKLRLANGVQRSMNYSLTNEGVSIETATRIL
jgi:KaiC/GvpD/RAD55 family RecA-like ATPase